MRENIYCLQGCDKACPTGMYLRFRPRVFPSSGFYLEVTGKFLPDYATPQSTENISYIYRSGNFKYRSKKKCHLTDTVEC